MADRVTAKSNIATINVPSVTNADLNTMLQNEICDNVVFKEDKAVARVSSVSTIGLDFTAIDRINLTRKGESLSISVSGIADGQTVYVLITKTIGQAITFTGVTDITPNIPKVTELATVLYQIIRKGANYFAIAYVKTIVTSTDTNEGILAIATAAECNALSSTSKIVTPGRIPIAQIAQAGVIALATTYEANAMTVGNKCIVPSTIPQAADDQKGVIQIATTAECNALVSTTKAVTPLRIPKATTSQLGISKFANSTQIDAGADSDQGGSFVVIPSELKRKYDAVGLTLYWYGRFSYASNTIAKYGGSGTLTLEHDVAAGWWQFKTGKVLISDTSIVHAASNNRATKGAIINIEYVYDDFGEQVLDIQADGDTDLLITIQEIINPV